MRLRDHVKLAWLDTKAHTRSFFTGQWRVRTWLRLWAWSRRRALRSIRSVFPEEYNAHFGPKDELLHEARKEFVL